MKEEKEIGPGRELDALIAEKIMGWTNNKNGPTFYGSSYGQIYADTDDWKVIDCPCYSDNLSDAWEVAEKILESGPGHWHYIISNNKALIGHVVRFYKADKDGFMLTKDCIGKSNSLPHAICLAALKVSCAAFVSHGFLQK